MQSAAAGDNAAVGLVVSLILIAAGAILVWAVNAEPEGLDIDVVGVVLIVIGLIGFLLSMLFWSSWGGPGSFRRRATYVEGDVAYRRPARRTTVVEDDDVAPGPPPP